MKLVVKTLFVTTIALGVAQTAQAGKFKDFFTGKKNADKVVKVAEPKAKPSPKVVDKSAKKESWFKRTFKSKQSEQPKEVKVEKKPEPVVKVVEPMPVVVAPARPAAPRYQGYKRVPRTMVSSTWTQESRSAPHINSERELDSVKQINDDDYLLKGGESAAHYVSSPAPKAVPSKPKAVKKAEKSDKKGNWFKRVFKKKDKSKK